MTPATTFETQIRPKPCMHLLQAVRSALDAIGDGLNDLELTQFLAHAGLPSEAGFTFLSFANAFVTLTVPPQNEADWYHPERSWLLPGKERIGAAMAQHYGFSMNQPPDKTTSPLPPSPDCPSIRRHLEFADRWQTAIVAHPCYLRVRLYGAICKTRWWEAREPLSYAPALLQDLSALYRPWPTHLDSNNQRTRS